MLTRSAYGVVNGSTESVSTPLCDEQEWTTGLELMKQLRPMPTPAGMGYFGRLDVSSPKRPLPVADVEAEVDMQAVMILSNAIISDTRAFVITEQDFLERYNKQGEQHPLGSLL